jgi:hypothetical protein
MQDGQGTGTPIGAFLTRDGTPAIVRQPTAAAHPQRMAAAYAPRAALFLYGEYQVGAPSLADLGLDGPVVAEGVAQLEGVQLLCETHAVAHV